MKKIGAENPYWSCLLCFAEAIHGRNFSRRTILRNFNALVNEEDYVKNEKKEIMEFTKKALMKAYFKDKFTI